jgi:phosphatidylinositol-4,5-bisphosphate 3-kinase
LKGDGGGGATGKGGDDNNSDIVLMLKVGDDLRQDALIIQLLRVMDVVWKKEGLDMNMMLYDCVSTGNERGLLQVVLNSSTLASIILDKTDQVATKKSADAVGKAGEELEKLKKKRQGSISRKIGSAMRALSDFSHLKEWIWTQVCIDLPQSQSQDGGGEEEGIEVIRKKELDRRINNFVVSCAAYCVASYVLGLGDRHNDNLMMTREGHFFHIDFGHILGNFKSKLGVKRERAPFIFTPAMKEVIDEKYDDFVELCCHCYNILRDNASLLVSLVSLAIPCNLPELREEKDVLWIYEKLLLGATDEEAAEHFKDELETSLKTVGTRVNDSFHMLAHA